MFKQQNTSPPPRAARPHLIVDTSHPSPHNPTTLAPSAAKVRAAAFDNFGMSSATFQAMGGFQRFTIDDLKADDMHYVGDSDTPPEGLDPSPRPNPFDVRTGNVFPCVNWKKPCTSRNDQPGTKCQQCLILEKKRLYFSKTDDEASRIIGNMAELDRWADAPSPSQAEFPMASKKRDPSNYADLIENSWPLEPIKVDHIGNAETEEYIVAIYRVFTILRRAVRHTMDEHAQGTKRYQASKKLDMDYRTYPQTLPGLDEYLKELPTNVQICFLHSLITQIMSYTRPLKGQRGLYVIVASPDAIRPLERPETHEPESPIADTKIAAPNAYSAPLRYAELIIKKNQKIRVDQHLLLDGHGKPNATDIIAAIDKGLLALQPAIVQTLETSTDADERLAAHELGKEFGRFPITKDEILKNLEAFDPWHLVTMLCRLLNCILQCTSVVDEERNLRKVTKRPSPYGQITCKMPHFPSSQ